MTSNEKKLLDLMAADLQFGCTCPSCFSEVMWRRETARLRFYCTTSNDPADRQDALDAFWALATGPFGPKDWPSV